MSRFDDYLWDPAAPPDERIAALERALEPYRCRADADHDAALARLYDAARHPSRRRAAVRRALLLAAAALAAVGLGTTLWLDRAAAPWSVALQDGGAALSGRAVTADARMRPGDVLATDASGRARLAVGRIGQVWLAPGSELELVDAGEASHRLALRRGEIHARIWAPPRFFVVDTRWAAAVDLGCIYTLRVDDDGSGSLAVLQGAVELRAPDGATVYVAAGTKAHLGPGGPGVPWPLGSDSAFRGAAESLAAGSEDAAALATLLAAPDAQATITLWHLLPRVEHDTRAALVRRIAELVAPPPGVRIEDVVALDADALRAWQSVLSAHWSSEPDTRWRRLLLRLGIAKPAAVLHMQAEVDD